MNLRWQRRLEVDVFHYSEFPPGNKKGNIKSETLRFSCVFTTGLYKLGGGFKHFLCSPLFGEVIKFD